MKKRSSVSTSTACQTISNAAEEKGDVQMLINIRNVGLITAKAKCHEACRATYSSKHKLSRQSYKKSVNEDCYAQSFQELVTEINQGIKNERTYMMSSLLNRYKHHLQVKGVTADNYRSRSLKTRLQNEYQDSIVFHQLPRQNQSELVYSSSICLQVVINSSSTIFASTSDQVSEETVEQNIPPNSVQTLYHAAQIIKADIALCKGINITPLDNDNLTLHKS